MPESAPPNPRLYGQPPYRVAVVHGGPGAGGEMAPVAQYLAASHGVIEPIQTDPSLDGQVAELRRLLRQCGTPPLTLIGYSWGAWLSYLVAAADHDLVAQLVLVSSGPFEHKYLEQLHANRNSRLSPAEQTEYAHIVECLTSGKPLEDADALVGRLGTLGSKTADFAPLTDPPPVDHLGPGGDIFQGVTQEAMARRKSGALLQAGRQIQCPVLAIHGDYDPHPAAGVEEPLRQVLDKFEFTLLPNCGHTPWIESRAQAPFYQCLLAAIPPA
ncbi:MAG: alpha/beta fold hydrolase [Candidatus Latescibacteria bacterium]|nr:alpha/beta fold hydrolase [Candidatus Latescibacterota bacterium]